MKFKTGDKVKVAQKMEYDARFRNRSGIIQCYSTDEFWINKGTPVEVLMDNGPEPQNNWKSDLPFLKEWPRYSRYYFAEDEIEKID